MADRNEFGTLISALQSSDINAQIAAIRKLVRLEETRAVPHLIQLLESNPEWQTARVALEALGRLKDPTALPVLCRFLRDRGLGETAGDAILTMGAPDSALAIVEDIRSRNSQITFAEAYTLAQLADSRTCDVLISALKNTELKSSVRMVAAEGLGKIGGENTIPALLEAVRHSDAGVRRRAAEALAEIGHPGTLDPIIELFRHGSDYEKDLSLTALAPFANSKAMQVLLEAVQDNRLEIRKVAAEKLGAAKNPKTVQILLELLKDPEWAVVTEAVKSLGKIRTHSAVPALLKLLDTCKLGKKHPKNAEEATVAYEKHRLRVAVIDALGAIGDPRAAGVLASALYDEVPSRRFSCAMSIATALAKLGRVTHSSITGSVVEAIGSRARYVVDQAISPTGAIDERAFVGIYYPYSSLRKRQAFLVASLLFDHVYVLSPSPEMLPDGVEAFAGSHFSGEVREVTADSKVLLEDELLLRQADVLRYLPTQELATNFADLITENVVCDASDPGLSQYGDSYGKYLWELYFCNPPHHSPDFWLLCSAVMELLPPDVRADVSRGRIGCIEDKELRYGNRIERREPNGDFYLQRFETEREFQHRIIVPFVVGESLMTTHALLGSALLDAVPFTDDPLHHEFLVRKLKRAAASGYVSSSIPTQDTSQGMKLHLLVVELFKECFRGLPSLSAAEVLQLREANHESLARFRLYMRSLTAKVSSNV